MVGSAVMICCILNNGICDDGPSECRFSPAFRSINN